MFLTLLGIIDILAGIWITFGINYIAYYLGVVILIKGIFSLIGSFASKFFLDFLGVLDIIVGLSLMFAWDIPWIGIFIIVKGIYSLIVGFVR